MSDNIDIQEELEESYNLKDRCLTFFIEHEKYGIDIEYIKEIIAYMKATKIPKTPKYMKGVINLRGNIIPIIDMRFKFGLENVDATMHTAIIITAYNGSNVGFVVDMVDEVLAINKEGISDSPSFGAKIDNDYIKHMIKSEEDVIMMLDLEKLLEDENLEIIAQLQKA